MNKPNLLTRTTLVALITLTLVLAITQIAGISLRDMIVEIVVYSLYGVFILAYVLRFGLIFLGVFAVYRILQERHNKQLAV